MEILVDVMSQEPFILKVDPSDTISNLKKKIEKVKGFSADEQRVVFQGKKLEDDRTVSDYNIQNNSVLNIVSLVQGKYFPMKAIVRIACVADVLNLLYRASANKSHTLAANQCTISCSKVKVFKTLNDRQSSILSQFHKIEKSQDRKSVV